MYPFPFRSSSGNGWGTATIGGDEPLPHGEDSTPSSAAPQWRRVSPWTSESYSRPLTRRQSAGQRFFHRWRMAGIMKIRAFGPSDSNFAAPACYKCKKESPAVTIEASPLTDRADQILLRTVRRPRYCWKRKTPCARPGVSCTEATTKGRYHR